MNIRIHKEREFSSIDNKPLTDLDLSMEAMALLVYLLSKPNNWTARKSDVIKRFPKNTPNKIASAFKELTETGYAVLEKTHGDKGRFMGSVYVIFERKTLLKDYIAMGKPPRPDISDVGENGESEKTDTPENLPLNNNDSFNKTDLSNKTDKDIVRKPSHVPIENINPNGKEDTGVNADPASGALKPSNAERRQRENGAGDIKLRGKYSKSVEFMKAYSEFIEYRRKEKRSAMKPRGINMMLRRFDNFTITECIAALNLAIEAGYKTAFPKKTNNFNGKSEFKSVVVFDE